MSTSQRVSRGFQRLAVFLAAIPLVIGVVLSIISARDAEGNRRRHYDELSCAHARAETARKKSAEKQLLTDEEVLALPPHSANPYDRFDERYDLRQLGCSAQSRKVSWDAIAKPPAEFTYLQYLSAFLPNLFQGIAISFALAAVVYGLVRAIGWVIGGFTRSRRGVGTVRRAILVAIGLSLLVGNAEAFYKDGDALFDKCSDDGASFNKGVCYGYILGVFDALENRSNTFCVPQGPQGATVQLLVDVLSNYLRDHPETRHLPAADLVSVALKEKFPCN
jgi:hypothetical protein